MSHGGIEVCVVVGTRPEIIKMAPVLRAIDASNRLDAYLIHTDQHYDEELSDVFFQDLGLPEPDEHLDVGSHPQGTQTARGLESISGVLRHRELAAVLAQGDTNAVLSTAIAASKLPVTFGHVEAGIRSYDRSMPEEVNRVVADTVGDLLFAPTEEAKANLAAEGIDSGVHVTGNTIVDACREHVEIAERQSDALETFDLDPGGYVLATIHRPRNTDDTDRLAAILGALDAVDYPVVLPAHPRTLEAMADLDAAYPGVTVTDPLDYLDFLSLQRRARVVVTDSGGIQEEASILEVPCVTVRPNTERPETVAAGVNVLVEPEELLAELRDLCSSEARRESMRGHPDLYGDGQAGERVVDLLARR